MAYLKPDLRLYIKIVNDMHVNEEADDLSNNGYEVVDIRYMKENTFYIIYR